MGNDDAHALASPPGHGSQGHGSQGKEEQEPVLMASLRQPTKNAKIHALPCTITHDGPASVSTFFMPKRAEAVPAVPGTSILAEKDVDEVKREPARSPP